MAKSTSLINQMRPCSVLVDSADVVKYFCGDGRYRYYPQLDVCRVYSNYSPPVDPPQDMETSLEELENLEYLPILDLQNPISLHTLLYKNNVLSVCGPSENTESNKLLSPVKETSDQNTDKSETLKCNESNENDSKSTDNSNTSNCNNTKNSKKKVTDIKTNVKKHKKQNLHIITEISKSKSSTRGKRFSKFSCSKCSKRFTNIDFVKRHIRKEHERTVHCSNCLVYYKTKIELNEHICKKVIIKKKKCIYTCELCAETIKSKKLLKIHIKKHIEFMKPLSKRELENVKFFSKSVLKNQLKNITVHCISCCNDIHYLEFFSNHFTQCCQNSNFICPLCNISKYHFVSMTDHLRRHLIFLSKIFNCHQCDLVFLSDVNMAIHKEKKHEITIKKEDKYVKIQCSPKFEPEKPIEENVLEEYECCGANEEETENVDSVITDNDIPETVGVCKDKSGDIDTVNNSIDVEENCQEIVPQEINKKKKKRKYRSTSVQVGRRKKRKNVQNSSIKNEKLNISEEQTTTAESLLNGTEDCSKIVNTINEQRLEIEEKIADDTVLIEPEQTQENQCENLETEKTDCGIDSDAGNSEKENQELKLLETQPQILQTIPSGAMLIICSEMEEISSKITIKLDCNTMCLPCEKTYTFDTFLSHLPTCLTRNTFRCSFCNLKLSKRGIAKQLQHLKTHFLCSNTESVCDMCELVFVNEHNMIVHVQNDHFM